MVSFAPTSQDTVEDQRLYTEARMVEVACLDCLAKVRVKKNSDHHTAIQWTAEALDHCAEFRKAASQPEGRPIWSACFSNSARKLSVNHCVTSTTLTTAAARAAGPHP